jgi:hypothetical protein
VDISVGTSLILDDVSQTDAEAQELAVFVWPEEARRQARLG